MEKIEAALAYADKGWKVFPCAANSKIPLAGTHGVKDATVDKQTILDWWTKNPDANIGLACGSISGVWVVDVDVRPDTGVNGIDSIREAGKTLPKTLSQTTPSGGKHFLYKCDGVKPANKNGFLRGVDIRGDGYYIVVAPSVINGKSYEWDKSFTMMTEYPDEFKPTKISVDSVFSTLPPICTVSSTPAIDRARAYLAEIPGAIEHVDGHAKLFWVAQVLVNGFRLSDAEAESLMWNEYNPKCCPPWNHNSSTEKEFRHKIAEAHRKPNAEALAIYDAVGDNQSDLSNFDFDACIADVRALIAPKVITTNTAKKMSKNEADLQNLLVPDGLVGEIASWITETAGCYQPLFALGASLTLCGALFGRKVCDESNGRTNIFCMGVGHSSCGKDHPGDCINRILTAAGAQNLLMGRMTSDSAIEKALTALPHTKIAVLDEVGHFFSNINKADGASYLKTIKPTLMELFSSAHKTYIGKEKASGNPPIIDQPCMCIWGVTAPQKLYDGMTIEELQDGWIARNLIFISNTRPQYVMKPSMDVPENIVGAVKSWFSRGVGIEITAEPGGTQKPIVVKMDSEARKVFDKFAKSAHTKMIEAHDRGDKTEYLWGKAFQNARRIALIVACGKEYEQPSIGKYEAEYGCHLVETLVRQAEIEITKNTAENAWERNKNRIRDIVVNAGPNGITQNELTRRSQWVKDRRERQNYLDDLETSCMIYKRKNVFGKEVWMAKSFAERMDLENGIEHIDE